MSKSNKNAGAPKKTRKSKAPAGALELKTDGASDALGGRVACRTNVIHEVLCELYNTGAENTLSTSAITERVNARWARALNGAPTKNSATASHMNTMKGRGYVEHGADGRGWRLTALGAKVLTGATTHSEAQKKRDEK